MAVALPILAAVGTAVSLVGTLASSNAQASSARQNADFAQQQSAVEQEQIRRQGQKTLGQQKAAAAASGVDIGNGSYQDVEADSQQQIQYDLLKSKWNGDVRAWQYRQQAGNASTAGFLSAGTTLIGGATKTYDTGVSTGAWNAPSF